VLNKMIEERISLLALRVTHHIAIDVSDRNMNAILERNYDLHRVYFHLIKFCNLIIFALDQFSNDISIHIVFFLVILDDFVDRLFIFFFI
jgi:hypothetical protein